MKIAILNKPTSALEKCELTFIDRAPIQLQVAQEQHSKYASALQRAGIQVEVLEVNETSPDAVFVEDVAIVLDELAVITSMGSANRRTEIAAMAQIIAGFRKEVRHISLPAMIEGGDILRVRKTLFVGKTSRTNLAGISALTEIVQPFGYEVVPVEVHGCLHLKTGITALNDQTFIRNPNWIDSLPFKNYMLMDVAADEPWGANVLRIDDNLFISAAYPQTADKIDALGFKNERIDISEFGKAEAGLTCMSLVLSKLSTD